MFSYWLFLTDCSRLYFGIGLLVRKDKREGEKEGKEKEGGGGGTERGKKKGEKEGKKELTLYDCINVLNWYHKQQELIIMTKSQWDPWMVFVFISSMDKTNIFRHTDG